MKRAITAVLLLMLCGCVAKPENGTEGGAPDAALPPGYRIRFTLRTGPSPGAGITTFTFLDVDLVQKRYRQLKARSDKGTGLPGSEAQLAEMVGDLQWQEVPGDCAVELGKLAKAWLDTSPPDVYPAVDSSKLLYHPAHAELCISWDSQSVMSSLDFDYMLSRFRSADGPRGLDEFLALRNVLSDFETGMILLRARQASAGKAGERSGQTAPGR